MSLCNKITGQLFTKNSPHIQIKIIRSEDIWKNNMDANKHALQFATKDNFRKWAMK